MGTSGRLSLSWVNKDKSLISTQGGGYEWVDRDDIRVTETRLLRTVATVGEVHDDSKRAEDNLLIVGDSGDALRALTRLPEFAKKYRGKVKLVYIDPPFNTGQAFTHYDDGLEHSVWLTMMRDRLVLLRDLLAEDGSIWVHLDDAEAAYCKVMMDEIFGRSNFVTTFTWQKVDSPNDNKVSVTPDHEYIICYTKTRNTQIRWSQMPDPSILGAYNSVDESGRRYRDRLLKKNGKNSLREDRPTMWYELIDPDGGSVYPIHDDGREANWAAGKKKVDQLIAEGNLIWKKRPDGNGGLKWVPYTREWAPDAPSRPWPTIWTDVKTTRQAKRHLSELFPGATPFATPKPEQLIERVLMIASEPGDIVLDCFGGSGTAAAVAHKMERRWVTVEREAYNVNTFIIPRLRKVVEGEDSGGISESSGWEKGGGFRCLEIAPSMYERLGNRVLLAPWVTGDAFVEASCAQIPGFELEPGAEPPFVGRKGRQRLAVVDGLVSESAVQSIVEALDENERVLIVAKSYLREAASLLEKLSPGSRIKKAPQDLLDMKGRVLR
ncbi:site-specific DNA-methyltransferase [Streptomyces cellulosae]